MSHAPPEIILKWQFGAQETIIWNSITFVNHIVIILIIVILFMFFLTLINFMHFYIFFKLEFYFINIIQINKHLFQIKSNHFYCHITTAQVPWWVKFLRACSRQCKNFFYIWTVHIYRLYRRQCAKYTYIYSVHIVYYKDILINYTLYTVCTHLHYVHYLYIM